MKQILMRLITIVLALSFICAFPAAAEEIADYGVLYSEDFESGTMPGWVSYEDKSVVEQTENGFSYRVNSYDYHGGSAKFTDYEFKFDMKVDYKEPGTTAPSVYLRRGTDGNRYEIYIDSANGNMVIDRVINEQKTNIGVLKADFAADNLKWVTVKFAVSGKNIWIYYGNENEPAIKLRDEQALTSGGIGFGFGNADFWVDNITITEISEPFSEPYEINPEDLKDYKDSPYKKEIDFLRALGIVNAFDDGTFKPDNAITRAEFAALSVRARNVTAVPAAEIKFGDVDPQNWAANVISSACVLGYMSGMGDGSFKPNDTITLEQAAKVLVRITGAELLAERQGGYPNGYLFYAAQSGITDGINKTGKEALTRAEVAKLIANTLNAKLLIQTGFGTYDEYEIDKNKTPLSEYHNIYRYIGRVTANYYAGIYADEPLLKKEFMLDGYIMDCGKTDIADKLGSYVDVYAKDDKTSDKKVAVHYSVDEDKTDAITVYAEDILDDDELGVFKYVHNDKTYEVSLSKNMNVILNGGSADFNNENLKPEVGKVTLLDIDEDSEYDVALVESYQTMVVGSVSELSGRITDKYTPSEYITADEKNADIKVMRGYQEISLKDLETTEVISIAQTELRAKHKRITIRSSLKKITGRVSEYSFEDDGKNVTINGKNYKIGKYLQSKIDSGKADDLTVGLRASLYLDSFGNVAYIKSEQGSDFMLLNGAMWIGGADEGWLLEMFDSNGEWHEVKLAKKFKYNDNEGSFGKNDFPKELLNRQIVYAKFNRHGEIAVLKTAQNGGVLEQSRDYRSWAMEYINSTMSFDTDSYVDENTQVFVVPYNDNEKNGFVATDSSYFKGGSTYNLLSYNEDKFEVADIILVFEKKDAGGNGKLARPFFYENSSKVIDKNGDEKIKITGYREGVKASFIMADDANAELNLGDALMLSQNAKGEVVSVSHLYRASDGKAGSDNASFGMSSDRVTVSGTVVDFDAESGRLLLNAGNETTKEKSFIISKAQQVYCLSKERNKIMLSNIKEIVIGDFVVMDFSWNTLRDIMIYR
ncbi:MAG: S-layer homology domain-containing protein [Clostridia bacterium]|nr:S-layer homology domain-containing protein [Clostridia bacterium]